MRALLALRPRVQQAAELLAHQPVDGFTDEHDAPELSWDELQRFLGDDANAA